MKKIKIIALAIILLSACKKDNSEMNIDNKTQTSLNSNAARASATRSFEITFTTTADTDPSIPPTPCTGDLPGLANAGVFLHGNATQLGLINSSQSRLQDVSCNLSFTTALLTTTIAGQMTGANGDKIYFTGNDEINASNLLTGAGPTGTITGLWTITGGTGRFANATGSFTINGPVDFATSTFSGTGAGTITY
jgi:hypothetical protein